MEILPVSSLADIYPEVTGTRINDVVECYLRGSWVEELERKLKLKARKGVQSFCCFGMLSPPTPQLQGVQ
ncbi:hypothetical protein K1719_043236 [Acacia pycnantha]|nr:hypothetical protein K1719_043236 [Acacia pycnantha]